MPKLPGAEDLASPVSGRSGRAIASYDTTAIGRGVAQLGEGIQVLGRDLESVQAKRTQDVDQATKFETQRRFLEFAASQEDGLTGQQQKAQPGAFGFREGAAKAYQEEAKKFFASVPEPLKGEYDGKLFAIEDRLAGKAQTFERDARKGYYSAAVTDGLTKIENNLYANPDRFDENLAEGNAYINAIPDEDVSPIEKDALRRAWKTKAQQASLGGLPPAARKTALGEGGDVDIGALGSGHEASKALIRKREGFRAAPYWDVTAHRIGYGSDTITRADGSVVKVRPGMSVSKADAERDLDRRTTEFEATARGQVGEREWGALPPAAQAALTSVTYNYGELPNSVVNAVRTGDIGQIASAVEGLSSDNGGVNAGRRKEEAGIIRGQAMTGLSAGEVDARFADIPWDQRQKEIDAADTELRQQAADERIAAQFAIEGALTNAPTAIMNSGEYSGTMPTMEQFMAAYGQDAAQKYKAFEQAIETSRVAYGMQTMSAGDITSTLAKSEPTSTGDDAALQQARYDTLAAAAKATLDAREKDPAVYVSRAFPLVGKAWSAVTADAPPSAYQNAVAASIAAQKQLGVEKVQPLPKQIAGSAVETFKDVNAKEEDRIRAVAEVVLSTSDPEHQRVLFEQLVDAGLPEITEGAVAAMARGDEAAADRLFRAAMFDPSKLPGKIDAKPAEIDDEIQSNIMAEGAVGDIYYGITDGSAENFERARRDSQLLNNAVNLRMRNGESLAVAVQGAAKDLYGDLLVLNAPNAQILLPKGVDPDAALLGLQETMPDVRAAMASSLALPGEAPLGMKAIVDAANANYIDQVLARGYFRNSGDGYVFIDPQTGQAVVDQNDEAVIFHPAIVDPKQRKAEEQKKAFDDFEQRTPVEPGAGPSLDAEGNPVVLE